MGKKIDGFVLRSAAAIGFYLYYRRAFENGRIAIILALLSCVILSKTLGRFGRFVKDSRWMQKRKHRRGASGAMMYLACMPADEAHARIAELLERAYGNDSPIELLQLHPSTPLSAEMVFECWRSHRGKDRLVICTTGRCDSACKMASSALKDPRIAILDADALGQLAVEQPDGLFPRTEKQRKRIDCRRIPALLFRRKNAPRCLLFACSMLLMHIFSGSIYYLISALALFLIAMISLRRAPRPAKLF